MAIPYYERTKLKENAKFLEELGYARTEDEYAIEYTKDDICISIVYPPCSDESDINIRYLAQNDVFCIGWIAIARDNVRGSEDKYMNVKKLLEYIESHYSQITDYNFCVESEIYINKYIEKHREKFDKAVQDFLSKN